MRSENPQTERAAATALGIEPESYSRQRCSVETDSYVGRHTFRPDMIILEHDHTTQVIPMRIDPSNEHTILFYHSKSRRRLSSSGNDALEIACFCFFR